MNRKIIMFIMLIGSIIKLQSQTNHSAYDLAMELKYKKGEVIVKFKDEVIITPMKSAGVMKTGNSATDAVNRKWAISNMENVFKNVPRLKTTQFITLPDGTKKQLEQLYNIYKLCFSEDQDANQVVEDFRNLPEVDYVELNGVAYIHDLIPSSPILSENDLRFKSNQSDGRVVPNDPFYSMQWYLPEVKADSLWSYTTGDTTQVIAILDTGVDWLHPDLVNKIWRNYKEIPDNGIDDDNNGFIDDIRGWDFVNKDNNPNDDNSHGTHCAGIAGAESNNGIGISGTSWGAKIMPIKVFQSNGIGYFSHIAEGFWYAARNGSTIFSNSWSSGGESITIRLAMEYAYSKGLIIAAAGNMNTKTDLPFPPWPPYEPNFPACYNWVLGVEATDPSGNNTWFSNFDPTGPVVSDGRPYGRIYFNNNDYNYEMRAPGLSFMSTVPKGQYRAYSGTSMACPLVAGSIALMKSYDPKLSNEQVFAKLIQTIKVNKLYAGVLDILKCTTTNPPPDLYYVKNEIIDSQNGGDNDGRPDAGETIDMKITIKNAGGSGNNIMAKIRFAEFEDRSVATIIKDTCSLGSISAYGKQTSFDAFKIKIDSKVVDMRIISFQLLVYQKGVNDTLYQNLTIVVEHGIEIRGTYKKLHLYPDAYYIVTGIAVIDSLIIEPGTVLTFHPNMFLAVNSYLQAIGKPDSMITFTGVTEGFSWRGIIMKDETYSVFDHCIFEYASGGQAGGFLINPYKITNCIFRYITNGITYLNNNEIFEKNVITNLSGDFLNGIISIDQIAEKKASVKFNIFAENSGLADEWNRCIVGSNVFTDTLSSVNQNVFINNKPYNISFYRTGLDFKFLPKNYFGTTNLEAINSTIQDFYENPGCPVINLLGILNEPPEESHGVAWKVEINDQNPQDVPITVGNGPAKFSVFFNRPMDPAFEPFLTFGVRFPFTQNVALDSARWSPDYKIWTAYKTIDVSTGDGENTIRVAYAKDLENFEIPIERSRFKFVVQAASSQSLDFNAEAGIGKVKLKWPTSDSTHVLGYNVYRYTMLTPTTFSNTILLNKSLINNTSFIDFDVTPGTTYFYMFTALRTDLSESDKSKVVQATPFNAPNGDANGDLYVNILDITTIVAYLLNQNPQPFIFEAADINSDGNINVLDIVGVVNIILNPGKKSIEAKLNSAALLYIESDTLFVDSSVAIGGIQFDISGTNSIEEIKVLKALEGFESGYANRTEGLRVLYYSMSGKIIAAGNRIPLLKLKKGSAVLEAIFADKSGASIPVHIQATGIWNLREDLSEQVAVLGQNFPNPLTKQTNIPIKVFEPIEEAIVRIFNIYGQEVDAMYIKNPTVGEHIIQWNSGTKKGLFVYMLEIKRGKQRFVSPVRKMVVQ